MSDWVAVLEAAYRLDGDDETWLSGVLAAAAPTMLAKPERSYAFTYDATNPGAMRMETVVTRNFPPGKGRKEIEYSQAGLAAADVEQSFGRTPCATASQLFGQAFRDKLRFPHFEAYGVRDTFGVNALDPTGRGIALVGLLSEPSHADVSTVRTWTQIAAHLAAARRLRTVLAGPLGTDPARQERVEAVVAPRGKLEYAANREVEAARARLVQAAAALNDARGRARKSRPTEALEGWRAMVQARWSLVEHFESDGKRYLVAVRNEAGPPKGAFPALETLTLRERQVVGFSLLGHSSKVAAYELGISPNTVRVLLARALKKLGIGSARELMMLATSPKTSRGKFCSSRLSGAHPEQSISARATSRSGAAYVDRSIRKRDCTSA